MSVHISDDELILHYYGDDEGPFIASHLTSCVECQERYQSLQKLLNTLAPVPAPERANDYGDTIWRKIQPLIESSNEPKAARESLAVGPSSWKTWLSVLVRPRRWVPVLAVVGLVIAAFLVGRYSQSGPQTIATRPAQVRDRVLLVAVGDHLERSQMVLVEIANATPSSEVDLSGEKLLAGNLVDSNRLFRQTAALAGESAMAGVLEDLERVLLDIANGPDTVSSDELRALQTRIERQGLLFKVRVIGTQIKERDAKPVQTGTRKS